MLSPHIHTKLIYAFLVEGNVLQIKLKRNETLFAIHPVTCLLCTYY